MSTGYRIAAHLAKNTDGTRVDTESQFARSVRDVFKRFTPRKIVETGTYLGNGTTMIIAKSLREFGIDDARFISIEINPRNIAKAEQNLSRAGLSLAIWNGLSVPREMLPTRQQIERDLVNNVLAEDLIVDHEEADRATLYHRETDFPDLPDDLLGLALAEFENRPDFLLLDSGGHMGFVEFEYAISKLRGPCLVALDDIHHVKHFRSFQKITSDLRFTLIAVSEEKFGFCVARFNPN
jgi:hypothetical protein